VCPRANRPLRLILLLLLTLLLLLLPLALLLPLRRVCCLYCRWARCCTIFRYCISCAGLITPSGCMHKQHLGKLFLHDGQYATTPGVCWRAAVAAPIDPAAACTPRSAFWQKLQRA
jgi:hypothetical protein